MKKILFFLPFLLLLVAAQAQQEIPLYQGDVPNSRKVADPVIYFDAKLGTDIELTSGQKGFNKTIITGVQVSIQSIGTK